MRFALPYDPWNVLHIEYDAFIMKINYFKNKLVSK